MDSDFSMLLEGRPKFSAWGERLGNPIRNVFMTAAIHALARTLARPMQILEIGSWVGASAATWSEALGRFHRPGGQISCVDPWRSYAIDNDVHRSGFTERYRHALESNYAHRLFSYNVERLPHPVVAMRGLSTEVLPLLRDASFDLVYVDGDHSHDACAFDISQGKRLVSEGGILCGDDLDLTLAEVDEAFVRQNRNKQPATDPASGRAFHPGVTLAVAESLPDAANFYGFWATQRVDGAFQPFRADGTSGFAPSFLEPELRQRVMQVLRGSGLTIPGS